MSGSLPSAITAPRRLYERLGFRAVVETGVAILPPQLPSA
jgi:hypothetical protein